MYTSNYETWYGNYQPRTTGPSAKELAAMFDAKLDGIGRNRLPRAYEPILVPYRNYVALLNDTKRLLKMHRDAVTRLAPDHAGRIAALKADPADFPRFNLDAQFEYDHATDVCRADIIVSADGPKFVELNVGAGIGGILEYELERQLWEQVRSTAGETPFAAQGIYKLLADLITRTCRELDIKTEALLIGTLDDPGKTTKYFGTQMNMLRDNGLIARFAELRTLTDVMAQHPDNSPLIGVVQFSEREANTVGADMTPLVHAIKNGLHGIPSQTARLLDQKKVLALLSEGLPWMTREDHEFIERVVPWSRVTSDRPVQFHGSTYQFPRLLLERPEAFVLKGSAGYSSQEVYFGANTAANEWADLVSDAMASEYYIAQEVVVGVRHPVKVMLDADGTTDTVMANPRICPFVIGDVPTGYYTRFDPNEDRIGPIARPYGAYPGCVMTTP